METSSWEESTGHSRVLEAMTGEVNSRARTVHRHQIAAKYDYHPVDEWRALDQDTKTVRIPALSSGCSNAYANPRA